MNRILKNTLIFGIVVCGIVGLAYYSFTQIDFIGHKDPKSVEENLKRWNNTILSAEYRNGTDYCEVNLLDSLNIEINVGDKSGGSILNEEYRIVEDTIIVIGGIKHANKYLNSNKFLIKSGKLLFKVDNSGSFDTSTAMTLKFDKTKL